jgi:adenylosuccinate synthase
MDKAERTGIRVGDMLDTELFEKKVRAALKTKNDIITKLYGAEPIEEETLVSEFLSYAEKLRNHIADTTVMVYDAIAEGKKVLFEGAQGMMLDIDTGTYPFVTASHPGSGGFSVGAGVGPAMIGEILGIVKAYTTRVGAGPMPTELFDETGEEIRQKGHEFGTTTGRPRRCGWFDAVVVKHAVRTNGITGISLMLLDVLDDFDEIGFCDSYEIDGKAVAHFPASAEALERAKPSYRYLKGWKTPISGVRKYEDLPKEAKEYIAEIEKSVGAPVKIVSVGPGREQTIVREEVF